jgi:hypothetical protein
VLALGGPATGAAVSPHEAGPQDNENIEPIWNLPVIARLVQPTRHFWDNSHSQMSVRREEPGNPAVAPWGYANDPIGAETAFCLSSQTLVTCLVAGTPMQTEQEQLGFFRAGL